MKGKTIKDMKGLLTKSYEDLRDFTVCHKMTLAPPRGLALFLRQGMPGWMEAWPKLVPSEQAVPVSLQPLEIGPGHTEPLPSEAAAILANMALAAAARREKL